jgi:hypothetical protein
MRRSPWALVVASLAGSPLGRTEALGIAAAEAAAAAAPAAAEAAAARAAAVAAVVVAAMGAVAVVVAEAAAAAAAERAAVVAAGAAPDAWTAARLLPALPSCRKRDIRAPRMASLASTGRVPCRAATAWPLARSPPGRFRAPARRRIARPASAPCAPPRLPWCRRTPIAITTASSATIPKRDARAP